MKMSKWAMSEETRFAANVVAITTLALTLICALARCAGDPKEDPDCEPCPECVHENNQ